MAHTVTLVDKSVDTFDVWVDTTNLMANVLGQECLTANTNANGAYVTGNSFLFGTFGSNTLAVFTNLRGGNVQSTNTLYITSNVYANDTSYNFAIGNSTVNTAIFGSNATFSNGLVSTQLTYSGWKVGANVAANLTTISVGNASVATIIGNNSIGLGNSSVSAAINSSSIVVGNVTLNSSAIIVGSNVVINTSMWTLGNATVNVFSNSSTLVFGGNVTANQTTIAIGNSTVNTIQNSSSFSLSSNLTLTSTSLAIGNSSVNTFINSTSFYISGSPVVSNSVKMSVAWENSLIASRPRLNFIAGNNVFLAITDDPSGSGQVNVQINAVATSGAAIIGGTNSAVQFNSAMNFGGDASKLSFDIVNSILTCSNTMVSNVVQLSQSVVLAANQKAFVTSTGPDTLDAFPKASFRSSDYVYSIKNNAANGYQTGKLMILFDDTNAGLEEYAVAYSNALLGAFDVSTNTTHVLLQFTPGSTLSYTTTVQATRMPI